MATLGELETALIEADKAGNTKDAQAIADEIFRLRGEKETKAAPARDEYAMPEYVPPTIGSSIVAPLYGAVTKRAHAIREGIGTFAEPVMSMASGLVAKPLSEIGALAATGYEMATGGETAANIPGFQQELAERFTYRPRTETGASPYNPLNFIPAALGKAVSFITPEKAAEREALTATGMARNVASEAIPQAIGLLGMKGAPAAAAVPRKAATVLQERARGMMQSVLKPSFKDLKSGDAAIAIDTMLEQGTLMTPKTRIERIRNRIDELNDQIRTAIADSPERVKLTDVARPMVRKLRDFRNQLNEKKDVAAIKKSWEEFKEHPYVQKAERAFQSAQAKVADREAAAAKALQDAWKLKTFEEQQRHLATGGGIRPSTIQPEHQPFIEVGEPGVRERVSTSAYPVPGMPRVPPRYTEQIERVPEGAAGAAEAMGIHRARKGEVAQAQKELAEATAKRGTISAQEAQAMKTGTYRQLEGKYGQLESAEYEAQKAGARGLKEGLAKRIPKIAGLNAEESRLLTTLDVAERKIAMAANKNPMGLSLLAKDPRAWAAFLADRSETFKTMIASMANRASKKLATTAKGKTPERVAKTAAALTPTLTAREQQPFSMQDAFQ